MWWIAEWEPEYQCRVVLADNRHEHFVMYEEGTFYHVCLFLRAIEISKSGLKTKRGLWGTFL